MAGCRERRLNQALSVLSLILDFLSVSVVLLTRTPFCVGLFCVICVFCRLVVLVTLSVPVKVIDWKDSSPKWPIMCWWDIKPYSLTWALSGCVMTRRCFVPAVSCWTTTSQSRGRTCRRRHRPRPLLVCCPRWRTAPIRSRAPARNPRPSSTSRWTSVSLSLIGYLPGVDQLLHCFIPFTILFQAKNSTFPTNLFHHCLLTHTRTAFSDYSFRFLVIFLSFYFGSCGRISCLNCQLSSAR